MERDPHSGAVLERELEVAVDAAKRAGAEVVRMREEGLRYGRKGGYELVTEADIHASEILHEALTGAFPDDGWLGEEHQDTADRLDRERVWIVDPIDGTREYLQGLPEYAISVGLAVRGRPVLGVVYNPAREEMHTAVCPDPSPEARNSDGQQGGYLALVSRGEDRLGEVPPLPGQATTRGVGSVAYRLALVAAGKGDVVVTWYARQEWDVAAGAALCLGKGLTVTDVLGQPIEFNQPSPLVRGLLVAEAGLHARIRDYFRRFSR
ncbi:MAG: 3'(2'),5'-bisphosphate nucleotidase CysQ [Dehalococcoidia bacterium]|nr:3'(2'),5'-bisphosphate nucleotidase CysQ [Dehalococcoidia bacterium]